MPSGRRWNTALAEHRTIVRSFVETSHRVAGDDWLRAPAPGKWSPAEVALHVCLSYELGRDSLAGGQSMRLQVSEWFAWLLRTLMLPVVLVTKRFPRGARAPAEIRPDSVEVRGFTQHAAAQRLERVAEEVAAGLHQVARQGGSPRFTHAYFGVLTPFATLRLLTAHTRHHERGIDSAIRVRP